MENLIKGESTFSTLGHTYPMIKISDSSQEYRTPENVTKIIENVTTIDLSGIEDILKDLITAIQSIPTQQINVEAPSVTIEPQRIVPPAINVESPKVEPKFEIKISTHWIFLTSLLPTLALLADIYLRIRG